MSFLDRPVVCAEGEAGLTPVTEHPKTSHQPCSRDIDMKVCLLFQDL